MSSQEIIKEGELLLENNWTEEELELIKRIMKNVLTYKTLMPKGLKADITAILKLANNVKTEYDLLKVYITKIEEIKEEEIKQEEIKEEEIKEKEIKQEEEIKEEEIKEEEINEE